MLISVNSTDFIKLPATLRSAVYTCLAEIIVVIRCSIDFVTNHVRHQSTLAYFKQYETRRLDHIGALLLGLGLEG